MQRTQGGERDAPPPIHALEVTADGLNLSVPREVVGTTLGACSLYPVEVVNVLNRGVLACERPNRRPCLESVCKRTRNPQGEIFQFSDTLESHQLAVQTGGYLGAKSITDPRRSRLN